MSEVPNMKAGYVIEDYGEHATPESRRAYSTMNEVFKDLPENHFGVMNNKTGEMYDLGSLNDVIGSVVFEDDQTGDLDSGVSHKVKFQSLINMFNSEPDINQGLNLKSELPVGYGYRFQYDDIPPELAGFKPPLPKISTLYWTLWSKFVNYDHTLRQSIHSNYGMGNVWTEKIYDTAGMNKKGWGVRKLKVMSPDLMHNVVDERGNLLFFAQTFVDTNRMFGQNFTIRYKKWDEFESGLKERFEDFDPSTGIIRIPRHKVIYWNYNAYYDDTVYGFGAGVPLFSYARSKIGIQKRILRMIDNSSSSMLVFKYGNENYMVSGQAASKIFGQIKTKNNLKYVLLPWYFDVEEKELGKNLPNAEPYLRYFAEQEMNGIGLPPVLTGRGGSSEGALIQQEFLVRQLMYIQSIVANEHRRQLFPEVVIGNPSNSRVVPVQSVASVLDEMKKPEHERDMIAARYPYLQPLAFAYIPSLAWNIMESVADKRLRFDVMAKYGLLPADQMAQEMGYESAPADEEQNIALRIELLKLEIEKLKIKSQEKIADKQAKAAAVAKTPPSSSK